MPTQQISQQDRLQTMLSQRKIEVAEGLEIFDSLPPVTLDDMLGQWSGYGIETGNRFDALLGKSGWYGKRFISPKEVHPLLFFTRNKKGLYAVNPALLPLQIDLPISSIVDPLFLLLKPILQTRKPKAQMRMIEFRGKVTGTMVYDAQPIMDHFALIDEHTLLGVMDYKADPNPYIFVLERDDTPYKARL